MSDADFESCRLCLTAANNCLDIFSEALLAKDVQPKIIKYLYLEVLRDDSIVFKRFLKELNKMYFRLRLPIHFQSVFAQIVWNA